jgi:hypothetical protein
VPNIVKNIGLTLETIMWVIAGDLAVLSKLCFVAQICFAVT